MCPGRDVTPACPPARHVQDGCAVARGALSGSDSKSCLVAGSRLWLTHPQHAWPDVGGLLICHRAGLPWQLRLEALKACGTFVSAFRARAQQHAADNGHAPDAAQPMQLDPPPEEAAGQLPADALQGMQQLLPGAL